MRLLLSLFLVFFVSTTVVFAQSDSDSFLIRVFGAEDVVAPTTPTLAATAVAYDQVNVSWTTSTDNFLVSGYVLYRNGAPISTTTLTSYSDVGLTASTTYDYTVRAFDPSFNYSSSSNEVSVLTPEAPVAPSEDGPSQSSATRVVLNDLTIVPGVSTSTFYIKTTRPARFEMRWGRTDAYELGYIVNNRFVDNYETTLTDLEPGTTYVYEVIGYTPFGKATVLERGQFKTLDQSEFLPPANVSRFMANRDETDVRLSWQNPVSEAFSSVRIVRSHLGFPAHPQDGAVVYQGAGESFVDDDILSQYSPVYYTAFVFDKAGNVSSGAIARVYVEGENDGIATPMPPAPDNQGETPILVDDVSASTSPNIPAGSKMPDLSQILLLQDSKQASFAEPNLALSSTKEFVVSIPKEAVSINLKSIIMTLTDPTDSRQTYSLLLRLNKDKTAYEAVVAPLMVEGVSQMVIDIYDYQAAVVGTYRKTITFIAGKVEPKAVPIFPDLFIQEVLPLLPIVVLPILVGALLFFLYRRKGAQLEDNN